MNEENKEIKNNVIQFPIKSVTEKVAQNLPETIADLQKVNIDNAVYGLQKLLDNVVNFNAKEAPIEAVPALYAAMTESIENLVKLKQIATPKNILDADLVV